MILGWVDAECRPQAALTPRWVFFCVILKKRSYKSFRQFQRDRLRFSDPYHLKLSTPEQKCIGWPEQKYISDLARRPPNWGPFRQASSLRGIIRRVIGAGRV
jgi:hypothetical protein